MPTDDELFDLDGVSARSESVRFELLDASNSVVRNLAVDRDSVPSMRNDTTRPIRRTVDGVRLAPEENGLVDFVANRVRVSWVLASGSAYPLGIFLFGDASELLASEGTVTECSLVDQCLILDQPLSETAAYGPGTLVSDAIADQASQAGVVATSIESATTETTAPLSWAVGRDTRLDVMQALCELAGFLAPYFDNDGTLVVRSAPDLSEITATLNYGANTRVIANSIVISSDLLSAPNRYVVVDSSVNDDPVVGIFDVDASAPHSISNRGYIVPKVIDAQGLASQSAANAAAAAAYAQDAQAYSWLSFDSPPDPRHDTFDVLGFDGVVYREVAWSLELAAGGRMNHECRGT